MNITKHHIECQKQIELHKIVDEFMILTGHKSFTAGDNIYYYKQHFDIDDYCLVLNFHDDYSISVGNFGQFGYLHFSNTKDVFEHSYKYLYANKSLFAEKIEDVKLAEFVWKLEKIVPI